MNNVNKMDLKKKKKKKKKNVFFYFSIYSESFNDRPILKTALESPIYGLQNDVLTF